SGQEREPTRGRGRGNGSESTALQPWVITVTRNGIGTGTTLSAATSDIASDRAERRRRGTERGDTGTKRREDTSPPGA
ncbi:hypothetical protein DKP78_26260, partial [Enterococcus faecium]